MQSSSSYLVINKVDRKGYANLLSEGKRSSSEGALQSLRFAKDELCTGDLHESQGTLQEGGLGAVQVRRKEVAKRSFARRGTVHYTKMNQSFFPERKGTVLILTSRLGAKM